MWGEHPILASGAQLACFKSLVRSDSTEGELTDPLECSFLVVAVLSAVARLCPLASSGTSSMWSGFRFTTLGVGNFQTALWGFLHRR